MFDVLKKYWIVSLVLGLVFIAAGLAFYFIFTDIGDSIANVVIGLLLLVLGFFLIIPDLKRTKEPVLMGLLIAEIVLVVLAAFMFIVQDGGNSSFWIGLILYVHGLNGLIGGYAASKRQHVGRFAISIIILSVGMYIYAANLINANFIQTLMLFSFLAVGIVFLFFASQGAPRKKKA